MVVDRGTLAFGASLTLEHLGEDGRATIFMVFPYMDHDLCGLLENSDFRNTHSLVKLYMKQLLEGTAYLHAVSVWLLVVLLTRTEQNPPSRHESCELTY